MTAGTFQGGVYGAQYYASTQTNADPNFTGTSWNATPGSADATTVPANAGWYTGNPTSVDNNAESLAGLTGRVNGTNGQFATHGIWVAHLVLSGTNVQIGTDVSFAGYASIKDGISGALSQGSSSFAAVPAPGALALLGLAGFAARRRRA
jgi:MYXO-CTERM domain-containing protein